MPQKKLFGVEEEVDEVDDVGDVGCAVACHVGVGGHVVVAEEHADQLRDIGDRD